MFGRKTKIMCVFLKKAGDKYETIDTKKTNLEDESVSFQDKTFVIPKDCSAEIKGTKYVFFDYAEEKILAFGKIDLGYDAKFLDQMVIKKLIAQLVSRIKNDLSTPDKSKWLTYILCLGLGALIGYTVAEQLHMQAQFVAGVIACL